MKNVVKGLVTSVLLIAMVVPATAEESNTSVRDAYRASDGFDVKAQVKEDANKRGRGKSVSRRDDAKSLIKRLFIQ